MNNFDTALMIDELLALEKKELGDEEDGFDDEDTGSLSSSESASSGDSSDDEDDDASYSSDSSSDYSLGSFTHLLGHAAAARATRSQSMPDLQLEVDLEQVKKPEHRRSLLAFMDRMNDCNTASYFQEPTAPTQAQARRASSGDLQEIEKDTTSQDRKSPAVHFKELFKGVTPANDDDNVFRESYWETYFLSVTEERVKGYTMEVVQALRGEDLEALKTTFHEHGRVAMQACTAQGESLIHLACRHRNATMLEFLVKNAEVSVKVRDDWHKTPLHELCWNSQPGDQFQSVMLLLEQAPELLFAKDKRGFTALQYVPKDSWRDWCRFLGEHKEAIEAMVENMEFHGETMEFNRSP